MTFIPTSKGGQGVLAGTTIGRHSITIAPFLLLLCAPAHAGTAATINDTNIPSEIVRVGDLDLQETHGWHAAMLRVRSAAGRLCAQQNGRAAAARCREESVKRGERELVRKFGSGRTDIAINPVAGAATRYSSASNTSPAASVLVKRSRHSDELQHASRQDDAS